MRDRLQGLLRVDLGQQRPVQPAELHRRVRRDHLVPEVVRLDQRPRLALEGQVDGGVVDLLQQDRVLVRDDPVGHVDRGAVGDDVVPVLLRVRQQKS